MFKAPRQYAEGIGDAVADRTINRKIKNHLGVERRETWGEVADRVAVGNALLAPEADHVFEYNKLYHHLSQASLLMSGRHLQHGDHTQPDKNIELFTNCSTAAMSFLSFYLLLNGSGVGRSYDDSMMAVDWHFMPKVRCVINHGHADVLSGRIQGYIDYREAKHLYAQDDVVTHIVADSREGWAYALAVLESMTYHRKSEHVLLLDFSDVRGYGEPIGGMQDRPASGPGPLMAAIDHVAQLRHTNMEPWRSTMYVDHYLAECVLVGGARRAARMATKTWKDFNVIDFCKIKRPVEFKGMEWEEIANFVETSSPMSFLYSANNSVMVDQEFWSLVENPDPEHPLSDHANRVLETIARCSYFDRTGEPGIINADKLVSKMDGADYTDGKFAESMRFQLPEDVIPLAKDLAIRAKDQEHPMIVNPCGEIVLYKLGGYCVIADVVPFHAEDLDDAEDAFRTATRALIRTNLMDAVYGPEVKRTNRIGVGMTGIHEFAYKFFGYGWDDLIHEERSKDFWLTLSRFKRAVDDEAKVYSEILGVNTPHTNTTMKPAGTTSKLFGLCEGAHLPSMREYLRWVQFRSDDPLVQEYRDAGYPCKDLKIYSGTTIVGFPTAPTICTLGMGEKLVTASEATPWEQYIYLHLLEKYWIVGREKDGETPLSTNTGNQISYTLKYDPNQLGFEEFKLALVEGQRHIRCCSVMPQLSLDSAVYEYLPEESITKAQFEAISEAIIQAKQEDVGFEHVDCAGGACPIDFGSK